jgi:hypothetical protein
MLMLWAKAFLGKVVYGTDSSPEVYNSYYDELSKMARGQDDSFLSRIFSAREVKHGLSIFTYEEINAIENLITEQDGRL